MELIKQMEEYAKEKKVNNESGDLFYAGFNLGIDLMIKKLKELYNEEKHI